MIIEKHTYEWLNCKGNLSGSLFSDQKKWNSIHFPHDHANKRQWGINNRVGNNLIHEVC